MGRAGKSTNGGRAYARVVRATWPSRDGHRLRLAHNGNINVQRIKILLGCALRCPYSTSCNTCTVQYAGVCNTRAMLHAANHALVNMLVKVIRFSAGREWAKPCHCQIDFSARAVRAVLPIPFKRSQSFACSLRCCPPLSACTTGREIEPTKINVPRLAACLGHFCELLSLSTRSEVTNNPVGTQVIEL